MHKISNMELQLDKILYLIHWDLSKYKFLQVYVVFVYCVKTITIKDKTHLNLIFFKKMTYIW